MSHRYKIILCWSDEDQSYVAEIPELAGCMADGKTYQEAVQRAEEAIQMWIETAEELGRPVPVPQSRLMIA